MSFVKSFSHFQHLQSHRHKVSKKARQYVSGLMRAGSRKNIERMSEVVPDSKSLNLQRFLTHRKRSAHHVIDQIACETNELLGDEIGS